MTVEPGRSLSHYRLVKKIGEGGMGVVWNAEDTVLKRTVAIKVLPSDVSREAKRREMFLEEARLASSISDAHIVQVYEFGRQGDLDFIVMEYVEGKSLNNLIHGRPLPADKVAEIGYQVARALSRAHRAGLIHRDLKPANILVTPDGDVKLVDFGLAALFEESDSSIGWDEPTRSPGGDEDTRSRARPRLVGTLPYMSPEQIQGRKLDARTDVYSFGTVLYEMTTGRRPFTGSTPGEVAQEILRSRPTPPQRTAAKLPLELVRIVEKCLARRRPNRYQTAEDLAVDLKRLVRDLESGSSPSYDDLSGAAHPLRRRLWIAGAGVASIAAAVLGATTIPSWFGRALEPNKVLVIPFEVHGSEATAFTGRMFAEHLAVNLAQSETLVIPRVPAPSDPAEAVELARRVGAGHVVTGTLDLSRGGVQATISLLDTDGDAIRWGTQERGRESELAWLAASLARTLADEFRQPLPAVYDSPLSTVKSSRLASVPGMTAVLGAIEQEDIDNGLRLVEDLVREHPESPEAAVLFAYVGFQAWDEEGSPRRRDLLRRSLDHLRRLDPEQPYLSLYSANVLAKTGDPRDALVTMGSLLERDDLTPAARADVLRAQAFALTNMDDLEGARASIEQALELDPANSKIYAVLSRTLSRIGDAEGSLIRGRQAIELAPHDPDGYQYLGLSLSRQGRWEESVSFNSRACELSRNQEKCSLYAIALAVTGREGEARAVAREAEQLDGTSYGAYNLACYYATAGRRDDALRMLRRALELGLVDRWIEEDPDLGSLHGDSEFEAIVAEVRKRLGQE